MAAEQIVLSRTTPLYAEACTTSDVNIWLASGTSVSVKQQKEESGNSFGCTPGGWALLQGDVSLPSFLTGAVETTASMSPPKTQATPASSDEEESSAPVPKKQAAQVVEVEETKSDNEDESSEVQSDSSEIATKDVKTKKARFENKIKSHKKQQSKVTKKSKKKKASSLSQKFDEASKAKQKERMESHEQAVKHTLHAHKEEVNDLEYKKLVSERINNYTESMTTIAPPKVTRQDTLENLQKCGKHKSKIKAAREMFENAI